MKRKKPERIAVVGLGVTGDAIADVMADLGWSVRIQDSADEPELQKRASALRAKGVEVTLGTTDSTVVQWADVVVPSKGVAPANPVLRAAAESGVPIWSEFELAWQLGARNVMAVTGTNGKTTTITLLSTVLEQAGFPNVAAGNLPIPLVRAAFDAGDNALFVCEASSFGLAFIDEFHPFTAIVLNVADDHYDWHAGYEDYLAAKARITENQDSHDLLVVNADDSGAMRIASMTTARVGLYGLHEPKRVRAGAHSTVGASVWVAGIEDKHLVVEGNVGSRRVMSLSDIRLSGGHNIENVMAVVIAALDYGVSPESIAATVSEFEGLPHRMSFVAEIGGVRYIDDSKATNPHATIKAMEGLDRVVLIAGGRAKGLDLSPLKSLSGALRGVIAMGEASGLLLEMFTELGVGCIEASDVEEAVARAALTAKPGDTVLLSPACSSVDQYSSYAERGERFAKAVLAL